MRNDRARPKCSLTVSPSLLATAIFTSMEPLPGFWTKKGGQGKSVFALPRPPVFLVSQYAAKQDTFRHARSKSPDNAVINVGSTYQIACPDVKLQISYLSILYFMRLFKDSCCAVTLPASHPVKRFPSLCPSRFN